MALTLCATASSSSAMAQGIRKTVANAVCQNLLARLTLA
jgi:hypothetical protein